MNRNSLLICLLTLGMVMSSTALISACSSSGSYRGGSVGYGVGYRGYYGRPWGGRPIYVGGGIDPGWGAGGPNRPVAAPLPEMGRPDFGGGLGMDSMDIGGMDMGGFDW